MGGGNDKNGDGAHLFLLYAVRGSHWGLGGGEGERAAAGSRRGEGIGGTGWREWGYCKNGLRGVFHKNDKILEFLLLRVEINFSLRAYSKNM